MSGLQLPRALAAWNTPNFGAILKQEIEAAGAAALPLQRALSFSSHVLDKDMSVMVLGTGDTPATIDARIGVFFSGVVAGCNCADDPTPVEAQNEYCELELAIDRATAQTAITLLSD
jgi:hypothetical protein